MDFFRPFTSSFWCNWTSKKDTLPILKIETDFPDHKTDFSPGDESQSQRTVLIKMEFGQNELFYL